MEYFVFLIIWLLSCGIAYWLGQADAYNEAMKLERFKRTKERRIIESEWNRVRKD